MAEVILPWLFGLLGLMTLGWFIMVTRLFKSLRERHPAVYEELGKPTLFRNNSIQNNQLFLGFLLKARDKTLGDSSLPGLCQFMRLYLGFYMILWLAMVGLFFTLVPKR